MAIGQLELRPADLVASARFAADVATLNHPDEPVDPVLTSESWAVDERDPKTVAARFEIWRGSSRAGTGGWAHSRWDLVPQRVARVRVELLPEFRTTPLFDEAWDLVESTVADDEPQRLTASAYEDDSFKL